MYIILSEVFIRLAHHYTKVGSRYIISAENNMSDAELYSKARRHLYLRYAQLQLKEGGMYLKLALKSSNFAGKCLKAAKGE